MPREYDEAVLHRRKMRSMELRRKGYSYSEIVQELQKEGWIVSTVQVYRDVTEAIRRRIRDESENAELARQMELDRLDIALKAITPRVETGDDDAIHTMMKIMVRRAKLSGLDSPVMRVIDDKRLERPQRDRAQLLSTLTDITKRLGAMGVQLLPSTTQEGALEAEYVERTGHSAGQTAIESTVENSAENEDSTEKE